MHGKIRPPIGSLRLRSSPLNWSGFCKANGSCRVPGGCHPLRLWIGVGPGGRGGCSDLCRCRCDRLAAEIFRCVTDGNDLGWSPWHWGARCRVLARGGWGLARVVVVVMWDTICLARRAAALYYGPIGEGCAGLGAPLINGLVLAAMPAQSRRPAKRRLRSTHARDGP